MDVEQKLLRKLAGANWVDIGLGWYSFFGVNITDEEHNYLMESIKGTAMDKITITGDGRQNTHMKIGSNVVPLDQCQKIVVTYECDSIPVVDVRFIASEVDVDTEIVVNECEHRYIRPLVSTENPLVSDVECADCGERVEGVKVVVSESN